MKPLKILNFSFLWILGIISFFLIIGPVSAISVQGISDLPVKQVKVGDISIGYKEFGTGYPLILIMGFSGAMDIWDPLVLQNLSSKYRVIIFDNRGVGYTTDSGADYTIPQFVNDTTGFMDALNISQAHILGWSMGSNIALQFTVDHPDRVNKLVLYAADPGGNQAILPDSQIMNQLTNSSGSVRDRGERLLTLILPSEWLDEHRDPREYFPDATESINITTISGQIHAMSEWNGAYDRLGTIKSPTLLITGDQDQITPPENSDRIAAEISTSKVVHIRKGGHGVMYQYPDEFSTYVLDFLNSSSLQG